MGAWGPKLYQDDLALDVTDQFKDLLRRGLTSEEITDDLICTNAFAISDEDDGPIFWFVLADIQWQYGRLLPKVKDKAIELIDSGVNQNRWLLENPKEAKIRSKVLEELKTRLLSSQPPVKKLSPIKLFQCDWKIGDVFAYRLESELAKAKGIAGEYLLIRKVDESIQSPGHVFPVVYVMITHGQKLPESLEDLKESEYIQTTFRFKKHEYRMLIYANSKRSIPIKKLTYVGNFIELNTPRVEFIIHDNSYLDSCSWSYFEKHVLDKYERLI